MFLPRALYTYVHVMLPWDLCTSPCVLLLITTKTQIAAPEGIITCTTLFGSSGFTNNLLTHRINLCRDLRPPIKIVCSFTLSNTDGWTAERYQGQAGKQHLDKPGSQSLISLLSVEKLFLKSFL